jgi:alkanesulfonate monooxygenase SsuD/methylene tetrahydromethanopterin reductase-like flavin-dependent oxidoreductase (luciferase family)
MRIDVLLDTFGTRWPEVHEGAVAAERAGFDGVWVNDHLAGSVEGAPHVLECWTVLAALAATVPQLSLGPLVLNVANRDPGTLAVMAATLQHVSGGRLLLGLGAGAGAGTQYATEQEALGRSVLPDSDRRRCVEHTIALLRQVWSSAEASAEGFLWPEPVPPIIVAAFGPKMAELAGRAADGICAPLGPARAGLVDVAREACARSGRDPERLLVIGVASARALRAPSSALGMHRLIVPVGAPFEKRLSEMAEIVAPWRAGPVTRDPARRGPASHEP